MHPLIYLLGYIWWWLITVAIVIEFYTVNDLLTVFSAAASIYLTVKCAYLFTEEVTT